MSNVEASLKTQNYQLRHLLTTKYSTSGKFFLNYLSSVFGRCWPASQGYSVCKNANKCLKMSWEAFWNHQLMQLTSNMVVKRFCMLSPSFPNKHTVAKFFKSPELLH